MRGGNIRPSNYGRLAKFYLAVLEPRLFLKNNSGKNEPKLTPLALCTQLHRANPDKVVHVGAHSLPPPNYAKYNTRPPLDAVVGPGR